MINITDLLNDIRTEALSEKHINSKVLIVDGINNYLRAFSVNPAMNDDGTHIGGIVGFLNTIASAIKQINPTRCVIVFDGKGGSVRRRKLFPDYKMNRKGLRVRLNRTYDFSDADEEYKESMRQLIRLSYYIDNLPLTTIMQENVEADDVIAYLATEIFTEDVVIMSTDKDFIQLINDRITIWSPVKKKLYNPVSILEDYKFCPSNYLLFRVITGDKNDNIPGIKGIGEKTLFKDINIFNERINGFDFDELIASLEKNSENKTIQKMIENKETLYRNYKLMKFGEIQMDGSTKSIIRNIINRDVTLINIFKMKQLFLEDKLYSSIPNIDSWISLNFNKLQSYALKYKGQHESENFE